MTRVYERYKGSVDVGGRLVGRAGGGGERDRDLKTSPSRPEYIHEARRHGFSGEQAGTGEIGKVDGKQGEAGGRVSICTRC